MKAGPGFAVHRERAAVLQVQHVLRSSVARFRKRDQLCYFLP